MSNRIRERLAEVQHNEIWSSWMRWVFRVSIENDDGTATIPANLVRRWKRQIATDYADLTEREKDSDRDQADKVLAVINDSPKSNVC